MTNLMKWGQRSMAVLLTGVLGACSMGGPKVDAEIMKDLKAIVANCKVDVKSGSVRKCKNKEDSLLADKFESKAKDRLASLGTFAVALDDADPNIGVAAAAMLHKIFRNFNEEVAPDTVKPAIAKRLIEAVGKATENKANQAITATVYAATLAKEYDALYAMMDSHSNKKLPALGYSQLMFYGHMDVFPKIQELAKSDNETLAEAALNAPRNLSKPLASEDQVKVCDWAKTYLDDERKDLFESAGKIMLDCKGPYIDALLAKGEERLSKNIFTRKDYLLYRDICFSPVKGLIDEPGFQAQCKRNYAFLEKAANNENIKSRDRGLALYAIYYQNRTQETLGLMQKYRNHKDKKIQKYATDAIKSLETTYKLKSAK